MVCPLRRFCSDSFSSSSELAYPTPTQSNSYSEENDARVALKRRSRISRIANITNRRECHVVLLRSMFCAVPLAGALALIVLNFKTQYFCADSTWLPVLQFIAKAHEILMQASIAAVMFTYVWRQLTMGCTLPYGAIFAALQTSQLSYIFSPEVSSFHPQPGLWEVTEARIPCRGDHQLFPSSCSWSIQCNCSDTKTNELAGARSVIGVERD